MSTNRNWRSFWSPSENAPDAGYAGQSHLSVDGSGGGTSFAAPGNLATTPLLPAATAEAAAPVSSTDFDGALLCASVLEGDCSVQDGLGVLVAQGVSDRPVLHNQADCLEATRIEHIALLD